MFRRDMQAAAGPKRAAVVLTLIPGVCTEDTLHTQGRREQTYFYCEI